jgi:very-short-patch-repair endonuclease
VDEGKKEQARKLRICATHAEKVMWELLRNRKVAGLKFRRQQVIDGFIADFFCEEAKLVIELDGGVHNDPKQKKIDIHREQVFKIRGLHTLRIKNEVVLTEKERVVELIDSEAGKKVENGSS